LKKIIFILFICLSLSANSQIRISYSIGSIGGMPKVSGLSSPILISGENCFMISNNIRKFWASKKGEFFASCMVDLDYIKLNIKITPNPVTTYANIKFLTMIQKDNKFRLVVYNNTGQPEILKDVSQEAFLAGYRLDMSSLSSGYYFIQIASSSILQTFKILKN
jgi:hypothetical protein